VARHQSLEVLAELGQGGALLDSLGDGRAQVGEQVCLHGPGDDEGPVMGGAENVIPSLGAEVDLLAEEGDLLGEGYAAVGGRGHGLWAWQCHSATPSHAAT